MAQSAVATPHALSTNCRRLSPRRRCLSSTARLHSCSARPARALGGRGQNSPLEGGAKGIGERSSGSVSDFRWVTGEVYQPGPPGRHRGELAPPSRVARGASCPTALRRRAAHGRPHVIVSAHKRTQAPEGTSSAWLNSIAAIRPARAKLATLGPQPRRPAKGVRSPAVLPGPPMVLRSVAPIASAALANTWRCAAPPPLM
ncbi:MAG: hypothetical protein RL033_5509 [Pseudomonadota bacterium]